MNINWQATARMLPNSVILSWFKKDINEKGSQQRGSQLEIYDN